MGGNLYNNAGRVIGGYAAHNIAVVGEGMVDAQVQQLFLTGVGGRAQNDVDGVGPDENSYRYLDIPGYGRTRPGVLALSNSVNVTVAGIQLANSHGWTSAYFNYINVLISGVRIYGDWRQPNSDGIDICSCTNTTIENVDVNTADDCITPKTNIPDSTFPHGFVPLVGLTVKNSRLRSRGFAVKRNRDPRRHERRCL
jgi:polygalacturonase